MGCGASSAKAVSNKTLLDSYKLGDLTLSNRVVMASMTRCRCDPQTDIPNDLLVKYYTARASAGLIITECAPISRAGDGFPGAGGIWNKEQAEGWKKVTDAVHAKGGKIFLQIFHAGRAADPTRTGEPHIAPSPLPLKSQDHSGAEVVQATPKEMTKDDIKLVIDQFRNGAKLAKEAGFDGIELHGANGYLVDQFLRDSSNQRKDDYGGSVENRCRFCLEAIDTLIEVFGANRVGIKLSPVGRYNYMYDSNPLATYSHLLKELSKRKIAYVQLTEASDAKEKKGYFGTGYDQMPNVIQTFRPLFKGTLIANSGYTPETGNETIQKGQADLISFAKAYINNPDLVERIKNKWPVDMNLDFATFFAGGEKGYLDKLPYDPSQKQ